MKRGICSYNSKVMRGNVIGVEVSALRNSVFGAKGGDEMLV